MAEEWAVTIAPKAFDNKAQGRAAHLGRVKYGMIPTPKVLHNGVARLVKPLRGFDKRVGPRYPGCAARPWASLSNAFGVRKPALPPFRYNQVMVTAADKKP